MTMETLWEYECPTMPKRLQTLSQAAVTNCVTAVRSFAPTTRSSSCATVPWMDMDGRGAWRICQKCLGKTGKANKILIFWRPSIEVQLPFVGRPSLKGKALAGRVKNLESMAWFFQLHAFLDRLFDAMRTATDLVRPQTACKMQMFRSMSRHSVQHMSIPKQANAPQVTHGDFPQIFLLRFEETTVQSKH